jgi:hypothetical protein
VSLEKAKEEKRQKQSLPKGSQPSLVLIDDKSTI